MLKYFACESIPTYDLEILFSSFCSPSFRFMDIKIRFSSLIDADETRLPLYVNPIDENVFTVIRKANYKNISLSVGFQITLTFATFSRLSILCFKSVRFLQKIFII